MMETDAEINNLKMMNGQSDALQDKYISVGSEVADVQVEEMGVEDRPVHQPSHIVPLLIGHPPILQRHVVLDGLSIRALVT